MDARRVEGPRDEERAYQFVAKDLGVATMLTAGMFSIYVFMFGI